tara:strand:- start:2122 stop:3564 length:1443 start_codon:yes stop_codon:yes gene_type:complete
MRTALFAFSFLLSVLFSIAPAQNQGAAEVSDAREIATVILNAAAGETNAPAIRREQLSEVNRFYDDLLIEEHMSVKSAAVMFGNGKVLGEVRGDVTAFWGDLEVNGPVANCTVIFGSLKLGPNADVAGSTAVIGGKIDKHPQATLGRKPYNLGGGESPAVASMVDWMKFGLLFGRPVAPQVAFSWVMAGLCFLCYLVLAVLFPRPVQSCTYTLRARPASSFLLGMLIPIIIVLIAITGIGLVIVPFLLIAVLLATVLGKASVMQYMGQQVGTLVRSKFIQHPGVALFVGGAIICLLYCVPLVGAMVWCLSIMFAMGAASLSTIEALRIEGSQIVGEAPPEGEESMAMVHVGPGTDSTYPPAGFWLRFCALILDWFIVGTISMITSAGLLFIPGLLMYYLVMWSWKETTLGAAVMNIKLVCDRRKKVDFPVAFVRALGTVLSFGMLGLGFLWSAVSRDKKSWHDIIAGTNVVRVPDGVKIL